MPNTHSLDLELSSSQYAGIADGSQTGLDITGNLTIEAWLKPESQPGLNTERAFVSKYAEPGNQRGYLFEYIDSGGVKKLRLVISDDGVDVDTFTFNQTLSDGVWYHVSVVWTAASSTGEIFVNGVSIGSSSGTRTSIHNSTGDFRIGTDMRTAPTYFDGLIDDVRVWNTTKTGAQILSTMRTEIDTATNLQGSWHLNNGYTDSSGNNNTLTASGSPTFSTDVPFTGSNGFLSFM